MNKPPDVPIQLGEEPPPPPTLAETLAPWIRRTLMGGCLVWICLTFSLDSEDARTHTIKATYPLFGNYEKIIRLEPGFDPKLAQWGWVKTTFSVTDGNILFVKTHDAVFALKIVHQS